MSTTTHHKENSPRANHGSGAPKLPKRRDHVATPAVYKVKSGDTLSQIADRFGISVTRLCLLNRITDLHKLKVGQELRLSGNAPKIPPKTSKKYIELGGQRFEQCPKLSNKFFRLLMKVANLLDTKPQYLLGVIFHETFKTMHPACPSMSSSGIGLLQFVSSARARLGVTREALSKMSREEQLKYVYAYLKPYKGKIGTLDGLYLAIINPASLYSKGSTVFAASGSYDANASLDKNADGRITRTEICSTVFESYRLASKVYGSALKAAEKGIKLA